MSGPREREGGDVHHNFEGEEREREARERERKRALMKERISVGSQRKRREAERREREKESAQEMRQWTKNKYSGLSSEENERERVRDSGGRAEEEESGRREKEGRREMNDCHGLFLQLQGKSPSKRGETRGGVGGGGQRRSIIGDPRPRSQHTRFLLTNFVPFSSMLWGCIMKPFLSPLLPLAPSLSCSKPALSARPRPSLPFLLLPFTQIVPADPEFRVAHI